MNTLITLKQETDCRTITLLKILENFNSWLIKMVSATNPKNFYSKTKQLFKAISSLYAAVNWCKKKKNWKNSFLVSFCPKILVQDLSEQFPKKVVWLNFKPIYYCKLRQFFKKLSKPHCESYWPKFPGTIFFLKKSCVFALRLDDILTSNKNIWNSNGWFRRKTSEKQVNGQTYAGYDTEPLLGGSNST